MQTVAPEACVEMIEHWIQRTPVDGAGALGVIVSACGAAEREALRLLAEHAASGGAPPLRIIALDQAAGDAPLASLLRDKGAGALRAITGLRRKEGAGDEAARRAAAFLESSLDALSAPGAWTLLWLTPHLWEALRHAAPCLAERWTPLARLTLARGEEIAAEILRRLRVAAAPMRHRAAPERARRRLERFDSAFRHPQLRELEPAKLAWGVILPWLRSLLDAAECSRAIEEFQRWAPAIESVPPAYGLALLCAAEAEIQLERLGGAESRLREAEARLAAAGHRKGVAIARSLLGQLFAMTGRLDDAESLLAAATREAEEAEAPRLVAWNCALLATLSLLRGREEEAHPFLEYAWALFETEGDAGGLAAALWADTARLAWIGLTEEAQEQSRRVWRILAITRDSVALTAFALALARIFAELGEATQSATTLLAAAEACAAIPDAESANLLRSTARLSI